jgi:hypothetical protein
LVQIYGHIVFSTKHRKPFLKDDDHYECFTRGVAEEVNRSGWISRR